MQFYSQRSLTQDCYAANSRSNKQRDLFRNEALQKKKEGSMDGEFSFFVDDRKALLFHHHFFVTMAE